MQKEATHERKGSMILDLTDPNHPKTYRSINLAKKASAAIQHANGGLGMGAVRVVK